MSTVLGSNQPMFVVWGSEGTLLYNDAYSAILAAKHPAAIGQPFLKVWAEIEGDLIPIVTQAYNGDPVHMSDIELHIERNGYQEEAHFSFSYTPVRDESGAIAGFFCACAETTAQVLADRRAAADIARQRRLFQQAPGFITILGQPSHIFEFVNDTYVRLFGERDYIGRTVREVFPELEGQGFFEQLDHVYNTGERYSAYHVPARLRLSPEGPEVERFLDFIYEPVVDETGQVTGIFCEGYDVTESHTAQAALRDSEAALRELNDTLERRVAQRTAELEETQRRFQGIFDSAFQFMALLEPDGTVVEVNQTALAWSQIQPSDIVGKPFWLAAPLRDDPALQAEVEAEIRRAAAGETVRAEHEMRGAGEVRAVVDFSVKPVLGKGDDPAFLVAEGRDVTSLRDTQEALRQSQKMEAMGALTGGVAHDFNNLLTPIVGSLDLLQRKGLGSEREQRLIGGAMQSAERAKTLVQRLLAFARRQPLQTQAVDVRALVGGMADLVASTSGPRVHVEIDVAEDLPAAKADANQVEMAILNLAVNARDAMPEGGTLTISAKPAIIGQREASGLKPGSYVRLAVADTGVGMDEATLKRAVEPFFSTKGIGRGTGLGLSMVHGLASQLGGDLSITSKPGLGTCVELYLPVSEEAASEPEQSEASTCRFAAGTVLLVDDEELVRMSTSDMLADLGYAVIEAGSAEEALRLVEQGQSFDLLVTDHLMPGLSGTELVQELRDRNPDLPALVVSGYAEVEGVAPGLPRLVKPFRQADLAASLEELEKRVSG
jgi:PAS domain S-box-containing protein